MNQGYNAKVDPIANSNDPANPSPHESMTQAEGNAAAGDATPTPAGQDPQPSPQAEVEQLRQEVAKLQDQWQRARAEADNTRKRADREMAEHAKYAVAQFARDLLGVADNLRRALESLPSDKISDPAVASIVAGIGMTEKELLATFERHHIKQLNPLGESFNHDHHQAIFEVEDATVAPGTVVQLLQAGYTLHQRLLRPAMVGVAKGGVVSAAGSVAEVEAEVETDAKETPEGGVDTSA
ncbi:MAG: nucleotide exchange factor GrpE [Holosporaceae bacterium]|jgi:molecular chaperone GrpE